MRVKKVNRYYCDYCKKAGCSGGHMKRHEEHCTLNPNRICGVCLMLNQQQQPISDLLAILPEPISKEGEFGCTIEAPGLDKAVEKLRIEAECPACVMAALRQKGIPIPMTKFDFKSDMADVWSDVNEANRESPYDY